MIWVLSQRFRDRGTFTIIFPLFSPDSGRCRVNPRDVDGNIIIIYIVPTLIAYRRGIRQRGNKGRCALAEEDVIGELYTRHACKAFRVHAKRLDAVRNVVKRSSYIIHIFLFFSTYSGAGFSCAILKYYYDYLLRIISELQDARNVLHLPIRVFSFTFRPSRAYAIVNNRRVKK